MIDDIRQLARNLVAVIDDTENVVNVDIRLEAQRLKQALEDTDPVAEAAIRVIDMVRRWRTTHSVLVDDNLCDAIDALEALERASCGAKP